MRNAPFFAAPASRALHATRVIERAGAWSVAVAAFALPLAALPTTFDAFVLPKLLLGRVVIVAFAALLVARWWAGGRIEVRRTPLDLIWALLLPSALASAVLSVSPTLSFVGSYLRYDGWWTLVTYAALFWLAAQLIRSDRDVAIVLRSLLAAGTVASVVAIAQVVVSGAQSAGETAFTFWGVARADAFFGNPVSLAMFLAMVLPLAIASAAGASSHANRFVPAAIAVLLIVALALTFSRAVWLATVAGIAIVLALSPARRRLLPFAAVTIAIVAAVFLTLEAAAPSSPIDAVRARAASLLDPGGGSGGTRVALWMDAIRLVAARPLLGFGPDTFALVYPHFQSGDWTPGGRMDKAHAEVLQIAATQGLAGVALYVAILIALVRAFLRRRPSPYGAALFAACVTYQLALQVNFTTLAAAQPFWLVAAAAFSSWGGVRTRTLPSDKLSLVAVAGVVLLGVFLAWNVTRAYAADARFLAAAAMSRDGQLDGARAAIARSRWLAPEREAYAASAGDVAAAIALRSGDRADWDDARSAYEDAARLGASDPAMFRRLATAYERLGRDDDARAAAAYAAFLARVDLRRP